MAILAAAAWSHLLHVCFPPSDPFAECGTGFALATRDSCSKSIMHHFFCLFGGLAMTSRAKASCLSASQVSDPSGESTSVALEPCLSSWYGTGQDMPRVVVPLQYVATVSYHQPRIWPEILGWSANRAICSVVAG